MRLWRLCAVSAVVATWAGCGGEDDPVPPPTDNGGEANDASMPDGGPNGGGGTGGADGGVTGGGGAGGTDEPDAQAGAGGADEPDADAGPGGSGGDGGDGGDGGGGTGGSPDLPDVFVPDPDGGADASDGEVADAAEAGPAPFDPGPPGTLVEFPLPVIEGGATSSNGESRIAVGSDDKLYVTDTGMAVVYRMDVEGNVEEFPLTPSSQPRGITLGPDGNIWFTEYGNDKIGRITPSGTLTEFPIPNVPVGGSGPNGITLGQDGNLWYTEQKGSRVGRIVVTPIDGGASYDVTITPLNLPAASRFPKDITRGPDGDNHIWFTEQIGRVAKVTTGLYIDSTMEYGNGVITTAPLGITTGPDGTLWFTEVGDLIGQSDTSGTISEYDVDTAGCLPLSIVVGSDDMLWYTCYQHSMLGRTDPADPANPESHSLFANSEPTGIVSGPGGALWFVDEGLRSVGYLVPP